MRSPQPLAPALDCLGRRALELAARSSRWSHRVCRRSPPLFDHPGTSWRRADRSGRVAATTATAPLSSPRLPTLASPLRLSSRLLPLAAPPLVACPYLAQSQARHVPVTHTSRSPAAALSARPGHVRVMVSLGKPCCVAAVKELTVAVAGASASPPAAAAAPRSDAHLLLPAALPTRRPPRRRPPCRRRPALSCLRPSPSLTLSPASRSDRRERRRVAVDRRRRRRLPCGRAGGSGASPKNRAFQQHSRGHAARCIPPHSLYP